MCDDVFTDTIAIINSTNFKNDFNAILSSSPQAYGVAYGNNFSVQGSFGITRTELNELPFGTPIAQFTKCGSQDRATLVVPLLLTSVPIEVSWKASGASYLVNTNEQWTLDVDGELLVTVNVSNRKADFPTISLDANININWGQNGPTGPLSNSWPRESLINLSQRINNHVRASLTTLKNRLQAPSKSICDFPPFVPQTPSMGAYTNPCDPCDDCCNCWVQQKCNGVCSSCEALTCASDSLLSSITVLVCIFLIVSFVVGYVYSVLK